MIKRTRAATASGGIKPSLPKRQSAVESIIDPLTALLYLPFAACAIVFDDEPDLLASEKRRLNGDGGHVVALRNVGFKRLPSPTVTESALHPYNGFAVLLLQCDG